MALQLFIVPPIAHRTIVLGSCALAVLGGGGRARAIGATLAILFVWSTFILPYPTSAAATHAGWGARAALEDLALLVVCLACLRTQPRWWVVWAAAFIALRVFTDVVFACFPEITFLAFGSADRIFRYWMCAALIWGAFTDRDHRDAPPASHRHSSGTA